MSLVITKNNVLRQCILVLLFFMAGYCAFSQIKEGPTLRIPTFGQVGLDHMMMSVYPKDTNAAAVIILEDGHVGFESGGKPYYLRYHTQVKILKLEGFELANISIPYLKRNGINHVEASVHNLENGRIITRDVREDEMIVEKLANNVHQLKISFPEVVVGSIIEYTYKLNVENPFQFLPWYFQNSKAPVILSTFSIDYPGSTKLKPRLYGYKGTGGYQKTSDGRSVLALTDLPVFDEEPYVINIKDHYSKVDFKYISSYARNWPDLIHRVLINRNFGNTIRKTNAIKDIYPTQKNWQANEAGLIAIHKYVSNHFKWDGRVTIIFSDKPKKVWETGEGHSADINLTLLMFLRKAGFKADPVFSSSINSGKVSTAFPTLSQFNNVVIRVLLGNKEVLVDATSRFRPYNILPEYCLNDTGLVVKKGEPEWVSMNMNKQRHVQSVSMDFTLNDSGEITGSASVHTPGYRGSILREVLAQGDQEKLDKVLEMGLSDFDMSNVTYTGIEDVYSPLSRKFDFVSEKFSNDMGERIFLTPVMIREFNKSPFLSPTRILPVEFSMPSNRRYLFNFHLPDGYEVEELPETVKFVLPNGGGAYSYILERTETGFMLMVRFLINKNVFDQVEYLDLREMFNLIISKQGEQVVLRKTGSD